MHRYFAIHLLHYKSNYLKSLIAVWSSNKQAIDIQKQNSIFVYHTSLKDSKKLCRKFLHSFIFVSSRNKQDIWAPKCHLLGESKTLQPYSQLMAACAAISKRGKL